MISAGKVKRDDGEISEFENMKKIEERPMVDKNALMETFKKGFLNLMNTNNFMMDAAETKKGNFIRKESKQGEEGQEGEEGQDAQKTVRFLMPNQILGDESFFGQMKEDELSKRKRVENNERLYHLRSQYDKFVKEKIEDPVEADTFKGVNELYRDWGLAQDENPDAYKKFFKDVAASRMTDVDKLKSRTGMPGDSTEKDNPTYKVINLLAHDHVNLQELAKEYHNFEIPGNDNFTGVIADFPGNNAFADVPSGMDEAVVRIQSWWRGELVRMYDKDLRFMFRDPRHLPVFGRKGKMNFDAELISKLYSDGESQENYGRNHFKYRESKDLDKIRHLKVTKEDIEGFKESMKFDLTSGNDYKMVKSSRDFNLNGKRLSRFNRTKLDSVIEAKKKVLEDHIFIPKNRKRRFIDILVKRKSDIDGSLRLSKLDWTLEASKSRSIMSKKKEKGVTFKKQQSYDTFKYSKEFSKSYDDFEEDFASQSNRTSFMDNSIPEAISYSKSFKKSTDSIPLVINGGNKSQSDSGSIPMDLDFENNQSDSGSDIPFAISSKRISKSKSRFNDNIHMEIDSDDDEIVEEFEDDYELANSKNMKKVSGRIKAMESSDHSTSMVRKSLGKFKKFVEGSKSVFQKLHSELDSMDRYKLQELKKNQEFTEGLISKMDDFIYNQKIEEKLDAILNKKIEPIIIRDTEGPKSNDELRRIMRSQLEEDEKKRREEHEENKAMLAGIESRVGKKLELVFDEIRDNIHNPRSYIVQGSQDGGVPVATVKKERKVIDGYKKDGEVFVLNEAEEPPEIIMFRQMEAEFLKNFRGTVDMDESLDLKKVDELVERDIKEFNKKKLTIGHLRGALKREREEKERYLQEINSLIENELKVEDKEKELLANLREMETPAKHYESHLSDASKSPSFYKESKITDYSSSKETMRDISWVDTLSESYNFN